MKSFPYVVCIIIGLWVGYMLGLNKPAESVAPASTPVVADSVEAATVGSELEMLRAKNLELSQRIEALEKELSALMAAQ